MSQKSENDKIVSEGFEFSSSMRETEKSVESTLSRRLDIEEEAESIEIDEDKVSRSELRSKLQSIVRAEVNKNRTLYRSIVYNNLSSNHPNWDNDIDPQTKQSKIDDLIDTTISIWVDRHINQFIDEIEGDESIVDVQDVVEGTIRAQIIHGIIERISAEAVYEYGEDVIDWFVESTDLSADQLFNAVDAFLRGLFGV